MAHDQLQDPLPLAGERVAVTGAVGGPLTGLRRPQVLALIAEAGGTPCRTVSGRTTLLVASRPDTNKGRRARELRLPVISPGDLAVLAGYPALW